MIRVKTSRIKSQWILLAALFATAGLLLYGTASAAIRPGAKVAEGNLTLEAKGATVGEILEQIARTAGIDIFIAKGFQTAAQRQSLEFKDEPLEEALRRVLRGYNYAAIYEKDGNDFRIAAVKIYPEGKASGEVVPLFSGNRTPIYEEKNRRGETVTVLVDMAGEVVTQGNMAARRGALGPSQTQVSDEVPLSVGLQTPWFALQLQQEQEETRRFADLLMMRRQAELAVDPKQKQALQMAYADQVSQFETFKRMNRNKVESLKRINQLQAVSQ